MDTSKPTTFSSEAWKPVLGWEGHYEVSNYGRVRSVDRVRPYGAYRHKPAANYIVKGRILGGRLLGPKGHAKYWKVRLLDRQQGQTRFVHHLVLEAWVGPRPDGYVTNHINGNSEDNRLENLEWCSYSHNNQHAIDTGLRKMRGIDNPRARFTEEDVRTMRRLYGNGMRLTDIAHQYGASKSGISDILKRNVWKHVPED